MAARAQEIKITRGIIDAIDAERHKQGYSVEQFSLAMGHPRSIWRQVVRRGGGTMATVAAACKLLDIEIVLVDCEGRALT